MSLWLAVKVPPGQVSTDQHVEIPGGQPAFVPGLLEAGAAASGDDVERVVAVGAGVVVACGTSTFPLLVVGRVSAVDAAGLSTGFSTPTGCGAEDLPGRSSDGDAVLLPVGVSDGVADDVADGVTSGEPDGAIGGSSGLPHTAL